MREIQTNERERRTKPTIRVVTDYLLQTLPRERERERELEGAFIVFRVQNR